MGVAQLLSKACKDVAEILTQTTEKDVGDWSLPLRIVIHSLLSVLPAEGMFSFEGYGGLVAIAVVLSSLYRSHKPSVLQVACSGIAKLSLIEKAEAEIAALLRNCCRVLDRTLSRHPDHWLREVTSYRAHSIQYSGTAMQ